MDEEKNSKNDTSLEDDDDSVDESLEYTTGTVEESPQASESSSLADREKPAKDDQETPKPVFTQPRPRWKRWLQSWWANRKLRYTTFGVVTSLLIILMVVPGTRYSLLDAVGVTSGAEVLVTDQETKQPLPRVEVKLAGKTATTDKEGVARFSKVRLGSTELTIKKIAYAPLTKTVTVGVGTNEYDGVALKPTGTQLSFLITDWLSGKPLNDAEASYGESTAVADEQGRVTLTIQPTDDSVTIRLAAPDYRVEKFAVPTNTDTARPVSLVLNEPHFFVSNRNGRFSLFKVDLDGKNEEELVHGTGKERDDIRFAFSPTLNKGVLVSTREGQVNRDGYMLSGLFEVDLSTGKLDKVDQSERIDLVGWIDKQLIYVKVASGASAQNPQRHRLVSYSMSTGSSTELAASNYFNDVLVTESHVFYAPSEPAGSASKPYLYRVSPANTERAAVHSDETWTLIRRDYNSIIFDSHQKWFEAKTDGSNKQSLPGAPSNYNSRYYVLDSTKRQALWTDKRDGKGVLLLHGVGSSKEDKVLWRQAGLQTPVQWLSTKHIVVRVSNTDETADYVLNRDGGEPKKIKDVSNVGGVDRWYFYY